MKLLFLTLLLSLGISACRHPIEIVGEGDVMSATGTRDCLLEDFQARLANCVNNDVRKSGQETYYAVPRKRWQFGGWGTYRASNGTDLLNYDHSSSYSRNLPIFAQKLLARHDHRYSSPWRRRQVYPLMPGSRSSSKMNEGE